MLKIITTKSFLKDLKRQKKRAKNFEKLKIILEVLAFEKKIPKKYRNHALKGSYIPARELHIEPDWLLIYKIEKNNLYLVRMGTHADLF